jgi:hypothetical protein
LVQVENGEDPMSLDELKAQAMKLSPEARAELAHALLLSLDDLSESEIEKLWLEEAIRRDEEIEAGEVELRKAEDVFRDSRKRLS